MAMLDIAVQTEEGGEFCLNVWKRCSFRSV
jgi:hypothetical protein